MIRSPKLFKLRKGHIERFDPNEIPGLLAKAQAGDLESRDELVYRFQRLISCLIQVCITGRPNYWSSYQKTFLRLFTGKDKSLQNVATALKIGLQSYERGELFTTGQLAIMLAIERCESNLASTIVTCFKDLIYKMIKDPEAIHGLDLDISKDKTSENMDDNLSIRIFMDSLDEPDRLIVSRIIAGEKVAKSKIPKKLKDKIIDYLGETYEN